MKLVNFLTTTILAFMLTACGHGYEGTYEASAGNKNEFMGALMKMAGKQTLVIGDDYIDTNGERTEFDEIFVRKSGSHSYLVFKDKDSEEAWEIIDDHTLKVNMGMMTLNFIKTN